MGELTPVLGFEDGWDGWQVARELPASASGQARCGGEYEGAKTPQWE